jgi:hypothetical protein
MKGYLERRSGHIMDLSKLKRAELGKHFEYLFVSKLIKLQFEVFIPLMDKGVDFILRKRESDGSSPKYFEVQVKSVRKRGGRLTISKNTFTPHERLFLVFFYVKDPEKEEYNAYVIPSKVVDSKFSSQTQKGQKIYRLNVTSKKELREIESYTWDMETDCFPLAGE